MTDKNLTKRACQLSAVCLGLVLLASGNANAQWQSLESIRTTALKYAKQNIRFPDARTDFHVGALDPKHRLPNCSQPLTGFLLPGTRLDRDTIVGVRCTGIKPWKVYVPVQIATFRTVFVTKRPVVRGSRLTLADLKQENRNVSGRNYISDASQFDNKQVRRDLPVGTVLTEKMLDASVLIKRGQTVTLFSKTNGLEVRMIGEALESGVLNQRIRVLNANSEREVEGIVRSNQTVEVML